MDLLIVLHQYGCNDTIIAIQCPNAVLIFAGKNLYTNEHVAIKLVSYPYIF